MLAFGSVEKTKDKIDRMIVSYMVNYKQFGRSVKFLCPTKKCSLTFKEALANAFISIDLVQAFRVIVARIRLALVDIENAILACKSKRYSRER